MPVKTLLKGPDGLIADVVNEDEHNGLVVATRPLKTFNNKPQFYLSAEGSKDMNVNVTYAGTPDKIHDGTDSVLWTASTITGDWTFDSTDQNHTPAGSKSIDATATKNGHVMQLAKGSSIDLSNYSAITGWVYLVDWSVGSGINMWGFDTGTGLQVGDIVDISKYLDTTILNAWQKFAIPLSDFGLATSTIDAFRIMTVKGLIDQDYYLDDLQVEETGTPVEFTIEPRKGTWLHMKRIDLTIVDEYDATLADSTLPNIPYEGFLGVGSLAVGILIQRIQRDEVLFQAIMKDLIDFMSLADMKIVGSGFDGTNTWIKLSQEMEVPLILKSEDSDKHRYVIRDNLSGLKVLWVNVATYEEEREL